MLMSEESGEAIGCIGVTAKELVAFSSISADPRSPSILDGFPPLDGVHPCERGWYPSESKSGLEFQAVITLWKCERRASQIPIFLDLPVFKADATSGLCWWGLRVIVFLVFKELSHLLREWIISSTIVMLLSSLSSLISIANSWTAPSTDDVEDKFDLRSSWASSSRKPRVQR